MSFITRITIPITNYEGNGIFEKHLYFECEKLSPTKEQVIVALERIDKENQQYPEYYGEENEALEIVKTVKEDEWKRVNPFSLVGTNTFVNHPKFGQQPLTWYIIEPIKLSTQKENNHIKEICDVVNSLFDPRESGLMSDRY